MSKPLDFSASDRIAGDRHTFFIYDGKIYNYRDFGNFLWALAYRLAACPKKNICEIDNIEKIKCKPSFIAKKIALLGANYNATFNTFKENIDNHKGCSAPPIPGEEINTVIIRGDSSPDQAAIKLGLTHPVGDYILQRNRSEYCQALKEQQLLPNK